MLRNPRPQPPALVQPRGGSTVRTVLEIDVRDYRAAAGFDYHEFERRAGETLRRLTPGTVIRLHVGAVMPPAQEWHQLPFGPRHYVEVCGSDPDVLAAWHRALTAVTPAVAGGAA
ncbi:hypothetical protein GCM10027403_12930 [Arthrobacter tecti]